MSGYDKSFAIRLNGKELDKFVSRCKKAKRNHTDVIREMIGAYNSGKIRIVADVKDNLYTS